jgi:glycosyltransferase involved in cell wall biosynthesis
MNPVNSILRRATRKPGEPLNVLTTCTHERVESNIARSGHNFFAYQHPSVKTWNEQYAKIPANYHILNASRAEHQIPPDVAEKLDVVLAQNKFGSYQLLAPMARRLNLPLVVIEHTAPVPQWGEKRLLSLKQMRGDLNVFISHWSVERWGWDPNDPSVRVIEHGIDTDLFEPADVERETNILSVVNDWKNRDWCCGYSLWEGVTRGLKVRVVGDTPGLSKPAGSTRELVGHYQHARIFLNTSLISPVPTSLMEAMACGAACVSTATCHIPRVLTHGHDGLLSNDPKELRSFCELLLKDEKLAKELGENARRTILEKFSLARFVANWDKVLREAAGD